MRYELDETTCDAVLFSPSLPISNIVAIKPVDSQVLDELKDFDLNVVVDDNGLQHLHNDPLYVLSDFVSQIMINLKSTSTQKLNRLPRIMGLPYLRHYLKQNMLPPMPPRNRSRYCCIMSEVLITIDLKDSSRKKELIDCIHFMSGSVRKDLKPYTTHFIAESVKSDAYKKFGSLGKPTLRPSWILEAWSYRDDPTFNVNDEQFINKHLLACFEGLKLYFYGFAADQLVEMQTLARQKLADVVEDPQEATHIIIGSELTSSLPCAQGFQVTAKWFWDSVQLGRALHEATFGAGFKCALKVRTPNCSKLSVLEQSQHSVIPDDRSPVKLDKKQQIALEMLTTEKNYIDMLELLLHMKNKLVGYKDNEGEGWIACNPREGVTVADVNIIFGKIGSVVRAHKKIFEGLSDVIENWTLHASIGNVWLSNADQLMKVYPPFINTFDMAMKRFVELDKNERFHAFVRSCESDVRWRKQHFRDLLVRPVQRLPSIQLLLEQCAKASKKNSPDAEILTRASRTLQQILSRANESRRQTENYEKTCQFFDNIENLPVNLRSSGRKLEDECTVMCLGGSGDWSRLFHRSLRLIVFNDILLIVKARIRPAHSMGTLSRMARQLPTISFLGDRRKPFKYIMYFTFADVRKITAYHKNEHDDADCLYMLVIRDNNKGDEEVLVNVHATGSSADSVLQCMRKLERSVFFDTGREDIFGDVPLQDLPDIYGGKSECLSSLSEGKENADTGSTSSIFKRGTLRNALSGTYLFRHFTGRTTRDLHKAFIDEENSDSSSQLRRRTVDLHKCRVSQSTTNMSFFARAFKKPTFRRHKSNFDL